MIEGEKVYLRAVERKNLETLRKWRNQEWLRKYFREYREITEHMQEKWYENIVAQNDKFVNFEILAKVAEYNGRKESDVLVGMCGLYYIDWKNKSAEFTIYIAKEYMRRKGFGSDALKTLLKYGFDEMNLNRIWCEVFDNNEAIKIYSKLGFVKEGYLRQTNFSDGCYCNSYIMGMIKQDYLGAHWNVT